MRLARRCSAVPARRRSAAIRRLGVLLLVALVSTIGVDPSSAGAAVPVSSAPPVASTAPSVASSATPVASSAAPVASSATPVASSATPVAPSPTVTASSATPAAPASSPTVPVSSAAPAASGPTPAATPGTAVAPTEPVHECAVRPAPGHYTCFALRRVDNRNRAATTVPQGFGPTDLRSAYALPSTTAGAGQRIYVIDAFGYANAESDLAVYRNKYGLPACTTANQCFQKLNQDGHTAPLPTEDVGWAGETALDLDMVSAICPQCGITLIEANSNGDDLFAAVGRANILGAKFVSMSWGGPETGQEATYDAQYFLPQGVVYSASSGDSGYQAGVSYPSTSKNVVAIGGTSLVKNSTARGWAESVWYDSGQMWGTGSGCSRDEPKPVWQQIISGSVCQNRAGNDVSVVADPYTGVAVYQAGSSSDGWSIAGGTSAGAPIIAAVYALAGRLNSADAPASYPYAHATALNDVTGGQNGSCAPALLCTAAVGWDGPTGMGTPKGLSAFRKSTQTVTMINPGAQVAILRNPVSLAVRATDSPSGPTLRYTAAGLPPGLTISASGVISGTPTKLGVSSTRVTATDTTGATSSVAFSWRVGNAGTFFTVTPSRLLDTRKGIGVRAGAVPANGSVALQVLGRGGVPLSGVSAVVLNVTVTAPGALGFVTVYPDGIGRPPTSNLDYQRGETIANLVVAPVGADGKVRLYTSAVAHLIADVSGYYLKGAPVEHGAFAALNPSRLLDTRKGNGAAMGAIRSGGTVAVRVLGRGGVPTSGVSAVVLNVTATGATSSGYVTAYPSGARRPTASNLDFPSGASVPNLVVVPVGADGRVALYVWGGGGTTNLIADVFGYYTAGATSAGGTLGALSPARLLDSRSGNGVGGRPIVVGGHTTISLKVTGRGGVPSIGVSAVVLNVLVASPTAAGYLTVYAQGSAKPYTSNLDYARGQTIANLVMVPVSPSGYVNLTVTGSGTLALIADVSGYYRSGT